MTDPLDNLLLPYVHYFEPVQGQTAMEIPPEYQTDGSSHREQMLLFPRGAQMLMLSWSGPEEVYFNMTNFWTSNGARRFRAGTIPAGARGELRSIMVRAGNPDRQYLLAYIVGGASAATVDDKFQVEVMVYPLT